MVRLLSLCVFALSLTAGTSAFGGEEKPNWEGIFYSGFKTIDSFGMVNVSLQGSAEKIGLKKEELTDYLRLRFKNSFAGLPYKEEDLFKIYQDATKSGKTGVINVTVWTVGDDYPIAYHIAIAAGNLAEPRQYETALLGYGSNKNVPDTVRKGISDLTDDLAVAFFKARSEL